MIKKLTKTAEELLEYFIKHPTEEKHIRGLAKETEISYSSVRHALQELLEEGLVEKREESKMVFYSARHRSGKFRDLKKIFNIHLLYRSGLVDKLEEEFRPDTLVLFGSYLDGSDREGSDIDIVIVNGREVSVDLSDFESKLSRGIHLVEIETVEGENEEFKNTLANGYVLRGYLSVVQ